MKAARLWTCVLAVLFTSSVGFAAAPVDRLTPLFEEKQIPLSKVLLYSSGVGYFEHEWDGARKWSHRSQIYDRPNQRAC